MYKCDIIIFGSNGIIIIRPTPAPRYDDVVEKKSLDPADDIF